MEPEYTTIPLVRTPEINPCDTIKIDLYWSGSGIPEKNRLYVSYNPDLISEENPGEIRTFVKEAVNENTGKVMVTSGEYRKQVQQVDRPGTHIGLRKTNFYPDPDFQEADGIIQPRVSERNHDSHAPVELRINTSKCSPGEYTIPIIFNYVYNEDIKQDRQEASIHVTKWTERHSRKLELLALVGIVATLGILFSSLGFI